MMNDIQMIPVEQLAHHPENPRLDLGDLSELSASIKTNGVLQNLTVVPADEQDGIYWVVIGNRRLEAAQLAGMKELPCVISDMDRHDQLFTMLQENMQRQDLTIYEQAKGMQLMMDLGFSRDEISEKTGFSRSTIDRRLAVASLPEEKAKEAVTNGFDLLDLVEISKIEDQDKQEVLLQMNPSERNLRMEIRAAQIDQKRHRTLERIMPEVQKVAKKMKNPTDRYSSKFDGLYNMRIDLDSDDPRLIIPEEHKDKELFYFVAYNTVEFYTPAKRVKTVKSDAQIALEKKQHDAKELNERMRDRIAAFIQTFNPTKKMEAFIKDRLFYYSLMWKSTYDNGGFFVTYHSWNSPAFRKYVGMPIEEGRDAEESLFEEIERRNIPMGRAVLALMMSGMLLNISGGYCSEYDATYKKDTDMDRVYEVLDEIGYQMDDEERSWRDGTHPIYGNEKEEDDGEEAGDDD